MMKSAILSFLMFNAEAQNSPVSKVVELLSAMQKDLSAEMAADADAQKKMKCWCDDTLADAENNIQESSDTISAQTALAAQVKAKAAEKDTKAKQNENEHKEGVKSLKEASENRAKELASFQEAEKELVQSVGALESAITVLSKHHSFMQLGSKKDIEQVASVLGSQLSRYQAKHVGEVTPSQRKMLQDFIQQPTFGAYSSQSGEIFGILGNMKDEFTADLAEKRQIEKDSAAAAVVAKQIGEEARDNSLSSYKKNSASAAQALADEAAAEVAKDAATESLIQATKLRDDANASCKQSGDDHAERNRVREREQNAVAEALEFLNSDEAHSLFGNTNFNSFFQMSANGKKAHRAAQKLRVAAFDFRNQELLNLAQAIKAGVFDKVIVSIDGLIAQISDTIKKDAAMKDECSENINAKTAELKALNNVIEKGEAKQGRLTSKIEALNNEITKIDEEIASTQKDQKELSQAREGENKEYQITVADQNASIAVLTKALDVLKNVYGAKVSLVQQTPGEFQDGGKHEGGNSVLGLISQIISDCNTAKKLAVQDENNAQKAYEGSMQAMNDLINAKSEEKVTKDSEKGKAEMDLTNTETKLESDQTLRSDKEAAMKGKQEECKFLFENFDVRLEHMNGEKAALAEAKSFLQGMQ